MTLPFTAWLHKHAVRPWHTLQATPCSCVSGACHICVNSAAGGVSTLLNPALPPWPPAPAPPPPPCAAAPARAARAATPRPPPAWRGAAPRRGAPAPAPATIRAGCCAVQSVALQEQLREAAAPSCSRLLGGSPVRPTASLTLASAFSAISLRASSYCDGQQW